MADFLSLQRRATSKITIPSSNISDGADATRRRCTTVIISGFVSTLRSNRSMLMAAHHAPRAKFNLGMEDTEQAIAETQSLDTTLKASRSGPRSVNRGALPAHLPREEVVVEPEDKSGRFTTSKRKSADKAPSGGERFGGTDTPIGRCVQGLAGRHACPYLRPRETGRRHSLRHPALAGADPFPR